MHQHQHFGYCLCSPHAASCCRGPGEPSGHHAPPGLRGQGDPGRCSCGCGGGLGLKRRFVSPRERKEKLERYIEELKNELEGAQAELEKLG